MIGIAIDALIAQATDQQATVQARHRAFEGIVRLYQDMAYGYAYGLIGDGRLAEDAAQEAFVVVWRKLADVRNAEAFPGWFRRVVRTQCDRLTRGRRLPTVPLEAAAQVRSTDPRPDVHVEAQETRARISAAIRSLPEAERVATTLYYLDGHTQKEIARFLGINPAAVSTRLYLSTAVEESPLRRFRIPQFRLVYLRP